jgi:hypothetical protein
VVDAWGELLVRVTDKVRLRPADPYCRATADVVGVAIRAKNRLESHLRHQRVVERDAVLEAACPQDDVGNPVDLHQINLSQPQSVVNVGSLNALARRESDPGPYAARRAVYIASLAKGGGASRFIYRSSRASRLVARTGLSV